MPKNTKYIAALEEYIAALESCPVWTPEVRLSAQGKRMYIAQAQVAKLKKTK